MEGLLVGADLHLGIHIISLAAIHGACKRDANIPGSARALACYDWRPRQSAGRIANQVRRLVCVWRFAAWARQTAREACALPGNLQTHLLGVLRLNPTAQVIRQRGV